MSDRVILWIKELQDYLKDLYKLFGDELADAEHELSITDLKNFHESLHTRIENALNSFIKWMETWVHLPLYVCYLSSESETEFAYLSKGHPTTFRLLEMLLQHDFLKHLWILI
ncbi:9368_t:CDS:2 [Dentiscutata erythropus]|uniref:9368_t:CDS:1 n=1 Tax=Dentiscutata erythropus TaxID=1348616 RepID=A0A9N8ZSV8_9GLOM|nr:9368_t:CDS:2 [Dentiscutata erythropus]